jgi:hypothetical protein
METLKCRIITGLAHSVTEFEISSLNSRKYVRKFKSEHDGVLFTRQNITSIVLDEVNNKGRK